MNELKAIIESVEEQWGIETVKAIKNKIKQEKLIWSSRLYNSVGMTYQDSELDIFMDDYGHFQDDGVKSSYGRGTSDTGLQFRGNWKGMAFHLKRWADSKGLNAYAVAYSIQNKGIKPKRFFTTVIEDRVPILGDSINKAIGDFMDAQTNRSNEENG
jgi:hypothetical protein